MAERRMFAKTIIDSDAFLEMPLTSQLLYFHLSMRADDDGFVNKPKSIMRMCGCKDDDLAMLFARKFLIPFESGVVVIKHWKIHNYIRKDSYVETKYKEEKSMLELDENQSYRMLTDGVRVTSPSQVCNRYVTGTSTQDRKGKDSIVQDISISGGKSTRFTPPTLEEVQAYCIERGNNVDAERFIDFYSSKGWMVGKNKMKDWKAAVRNWERTEPKKAESSFDVDDFFDAAINKSYGG